MLYTSQEICTILDMSGLLELIPEDNLKVVRALYDDPSRHYHDFDHAAEVLSWLNRALEDISEEELAPFTAAELRLAALFHDVVYTSEGSPTNEEKSCQLARQTLGWGDDISAESVERVCELIMLTAQHGKLEASDVPLAGQLMLDADIASLGQPRWEIFLYNNGNVVEELEVKYTSEQISAGRKAFFSSMLTKKSIYLSEWFRERFEEQARRNLERARGMLETPRKGNR